MIEHVADLVLIELRVERLDIVVRPLPTVASAEKRAADGRVQPHADGDVLHECKAEEAPEPAVVGGS